MHQSKISRIYKDLRDNKISVGSLGDFHQYLPPKILPGFRCSWNPIWSHRLAIEIACRLSEDGDYGTFLKPLIKYRDEYEKMYSTMPLCSNKSISHYVGLCALDALLKNVNEKHISRLAVIFNQVVKDGAFTEGGHYSEYVMECFNRTGVLFDNWFGESSNKILRDSYVHISKNAGKVKTWQQRITDTDGVMAVIGDGWHEKVFPSVVDGVFYYEDMTIHRQDDWVAIHNHRQNSFSLHEHPHGDEILIAHKNDWLIKGSGMPSYKHIMRQPWKWRRPRNHFFTESIWVWWVLWRMRVKLAIDGPGSRAIDIEGNTLFIYETGKKVVRLPGNRSDVAVLTNDLRWEYGPFYLKVTGINTKLLRGDHAHAATTYGNEETIPVVRIKGENIITRIGLINGNN